MGEGTNENSSGMCDHAGSHHDMVKNGFANDDCRNDDSVVKLDEMSGYVVADSFEDDAQILGDNTKKSIGNHHHYPEDACYGRKGIPPSKQDEWLGSGALHQRCGSQGQAWEPGWAPAGSVGD